MSSGVIYVLTNPSFPEYVKIGYADNLENRLNQLNRSECLPFAFRVYCTYEVEGRLKDKDVHGLIDKLNPDLRAIETFDGKKRIREFYYMSAEDAYEILDSIARISGTSERLKRMKPEGHEVQDEAEAKELQKYSRYEYTEEDHLAHSSALTEDLYYKIKERILALGAIDIDPKKLYIAFKGNTNICDVEIQNSKLKITINMKKGTLNDTEDIAMDISNVGHWGNGDYQAFVRNDADIDSVMKLIMQSYDVNKKEA